MQADNVAVPNEKNYKLCLPSPSKPAGRNIYSFTQVLFVFVEPTSKKKQVD